MPETELVAVGLDYETEQPWVEVDILDPDPDYYGDNRWLLREVPAEVAERFRAARAEITAAVEAVHQAACYDPAHCRLLEVCGSYKGKPVTINDRTYWDECKTCGWQKDEHPDNANVPVLTPETGLVQADNGRNQP